MKDIFPQRRSSQGLNRRKNGVKGGSEEPGFSGPCFRKSLSSKFKSIDIYGQSINLTYRGSESFKTTSGALTSLFVLGVLLAYTAYRSYVLFNRINPDISKKGLMRDLNSEEPFRPQDFGFDLAFGIG
jgi:hypothetical protein